MDIFEGLNEPQREAVEYIDGPLLVLAGAGSGKTRVITRRLAYMISLGIDPASIVAITLHSSVSLVSCLRLCKLPVHFFSPSH